MICNKCQLFRWSNIEPIGNTTNSVGVKICIGGIAYEFGIDFGCVGCDVMILLLLLMYIDNVKWKVVINCRCILHFFLITLVWLCGDHVR